MMALREEDGNTETGTVAAAGEGHLYTSQQNGWSMYTLPTSNVCRYPFVSYIMYVAGSLDGPHILPDVFEIDQLIFVG